MNESEKKKLNDAELKRIIREAELELKKYEAWEKRQKAKSGYQRFMEFMFPELAGVPIGWLIIGIICILFSALTMII